MSDLTEQIYCAQQISIPPTFPRVLKHYAKSAIRTQPHDLLRWTAAYFRALANGETPPAKERLEYPPYVHPTGITPGYLRTLLHRFGRAAADVGLADLLEDWRGLDLPEPSLYRILAVAGLTRGDDGDVRCDLRRLLAVACGFLGNNLLETMVHVCELLTHEPEGGSATIPLRVFLDLYEYLARLDCGGERRAEGDAALSVSSSSELSRGTIDSRARSCGFAAEKDDLCECDADVVSDARGPSDASESDSASAGETTRERDEEKAIDDEEETVASIDLESSAEKTCVCVAGLESDDETPPPPPSDPLKAFLRRMRAEVKAGRLATVFPVAGIGSPVPPQRVTAVALWLADCARRQEGLVGPRNIRHFLCPPLGDVLPECDCA